MKGLRKDMQEKISRLRSRSAERISKRRSLRRSSPSEERVSQRSERSASISVEDEYDLHHPPYRRMTKSYSGLPTPNAPVMYNGPFIGRARALVDYIPSPYDRDALRFNVSYNWVMHVWGYFFMRMPAVRITHCFRSHRFSNFYKGSPDLGTREGKQWEIVVLCTYRKDDQIQFLKFKIHISNRAVAQCIKERPEGASF